MCGINLIIDKTKSLPDDIIRAMAEKTQHRGPDETVIKIFKTNISNYYLAANRLKITDHSDNGAQPFISTDNQQALLFNGEIYNHYALKNELLNKSIRFSSHSDTEVLFYWLKIFGKSRINELEGMFAFAFINLESQEVFIGRDRFGIKPIYYFQDDRYFIISSEIQSLVQTGLIRKKLNENQVYHYLRYKYAKPPETFYKGVYELTPGNVLTFKKKEVHFDTFKQSPDVSVQENLNPGKIEDLVKESLLQQINASVPVGLLLSGGVDSTLLLALAKNEGYSIPSYSIVNTNKDKSFGTEDYRYAKKAARLYSSEHHELELDISILDQLEEFIKKMDQPIGDSSYIMTSEICKYASASQSSGLGGMKILLSGAGADELFGGYNRHWAFYKYLKNKDLINTVSPLLKPLANHLPTGFSHPLRKPFRLVKKLFQNFDHSPEKTFQNFLIFDEASKSGNHIANLNKNLDSNNSWLSWALTQDIENYLVNDVLALSDRASMQHGIELRVPYLSEKLAIAIHQNSNSEYLFQNGRKWILREILIKHGGKLFADRSKEGFGLPLGHWLTDEQTGHLWEFVNNPGHKVFGFINQDILKSLISDQKRKESDHGPFLWSVLTLAHWLDHHLS